MGWERGRRLQTARLFAAAPSVAFAVGARSSIPPAAPRWPSPERSGPLGRHGDSRTKVFGGTDMQDEVERVEAVAGLAPAGSQLAPASAAGGDGAGDGAVAWHALSAQEAADHLAVDPAAGLGADEAERRLRQYGPNELARSRRRAPG